MGKKRLDLLASQAARTFPITRRAFISGALLSAIPFTRGYAKSGGEPVVLGGTISLTGKYQAMGEERERATRLWEEEVNRTGGILGRPVMVDLVDDASNPEKAKARYLELIRTKKAHLLLCPYSSEINIPLVPMAEEHRYPFLTTSSTDSIWETPRKFVMGLYTTNKRYFIGFLEMVATRGIKKISVVSYDNPFSISAADGVDRWAKRFGVEIARTDHLPDGKSPERFAAIAPGIAASGAKAVVVTGYLDEAVNARKGFASGPASNLLFAASIGPAMNEFKERLGDQANDAFGPSQWEPTDRITYPGSARFIETYRKRFGIDPSYHAAAAYASGQILAEAARRAKSLDREKIRTVLATQTLRSVIGSFKTRDGLQIGHKTLVVQWQDGKKEIVWPEDMRTKHPRFPV